MKTIVYNGRKFSAAEICVREWRQVANEVVGEELVEWFLEDYKDEAPDGYYDVEASGLYSLLLEDERFDGCYDVAADVEEF